MLASKMIPSPSYHSHFPQYGTLAIVQQRIRKYLGKITKTAFKIACGFGVSAAGTEMWGTGEVVEVSPYSI